MVLMKARRVVIVIPQQLAFGFQVKILEVVRKNYRLHTFSVFSEKLAPCTNQTAEAFEASWQSMRLRIMGFVRWLKPHLSNSPVSVWEITPL